MTNQHFKEFGKIKKINPDQLNPKPSGQKFDETRLSEASHSVAVFEAEKQDSNDKKTDHR